MKQIECPNCGAVFSAEETRCPYCAFINPEGAEAKYLKDLESRRLELDMVDDQVRSGYRKDMNKGARTALRTVLITALVLAVLVGIWYVSENRLFSRDREDYASELVWEHEHFPEYDALFEAQDYDGLLERLAEDGETHDVWNWEHYEEFMEIADRLWEDEQ